MKPVQPSLYIHIPFCEVKCGYCDFYSVPRGWEEFDLQEAYVEALCREIDEQYSVGAGSPRPKSATSDGRGNHAPTTGQVQITSIFFGGGTPSLLRTDLLEKILNKLSEHFSWDDDTEITLECNPKTIDKDRLAERKALGINRISMGVQSFQDRFLKTLGRIHSGDEARRTIEAAQTVGFEKLSFDLMFSLPGQSFEDWQKDLETALSVGTQHLSCYNLTIEPNTPFEQIYRRGDPVGRPQSDKIPGRATGSPLLSDDVALKQFLWTRERLDKAGLPAYEISNFAAPGYECVHNQNYWQYGEYLGFGVSAASFVRSSEFHAIRSINVRNLNQYIAGETPPEIDAIDKRTAMGEFVMLALRTREGVSEERFEEEFGQTFQEAFSEVLERVGAGSPRPQLTSSAGGGTPPLRNIDGHWRLTDEGLRMADSVVMEFL